MALNKFFSSYSAEEWLALAHLAKQQTCHAGFYNDNYRLVQDGKALLFRFPKQKEEEMDPRPISEIEIYKILQGKGIPMPAFIYAPDDQSFQVHEFIQGTLVDEVYPPGQRIPGAHIQQIADYYCKMALLEIDPDPILSMEWPRRGPPLTFFEKLLEKGWIIFRDHQETHGDIYSFLNIPADPFSAFLIKAGGLTKRPWRLMHADIHRANMIEKENGQIVVIDWELALYGDLLFCIAAHLHRCRFYPDEKEEIARAIYEKLPQEFQKNFMMDLSFYLDYEAVKSILTDSVRFPYLLKNQTVSNSAMMELCVYYSDNLTRIAPILGTKTFPPERVLGLFQEWAR